MGLLEYGIAEGLTVNAQYDKRINDLRYNEQAKNRAIKDKEAEAKMFADDFKYENAMNTYDHEKVKLHAESKSNEIGKFMINNPGWKTDPMLRGKYSNMVSELKDSKDYRRGLTSDSSMKDMSAYQKNPKNGSVTGSDRWKDVEQQKANYLQFGNQYARTQEEANELGQEAFSFVPPQEMIDVNAKGLTIGSKLGQREFGVGGAFGASVTKTPKEFINDAAVAELSGKDAWAWEQSYKDLDPTSRSSYEGNGGVSSYVFDAIEKGTDVSRDFGSAPSGNGNGSGRDNAVLAYVREIESKSEGYAPVTNIKAISPIVNGQFNSSPTDNMQFLVDEGNGPEYKNLVGFYGKPVEANETGKFKTIQTGEGSGQKMIEMQVTVPLDPSMLGGDGPFASDQSWYDFTKVNPEEFLTKESYTGIAVADFETDADGEKRYNGNAKLKVWVKARTGQANRNRYGKLATGQSEANKAYQATDEIIKQSDQIRIARSIRVGEIKNINGINYTRDSEGKIVQVQ